jgi:tetratricopeptide (TPR) repeat protein
MQTPTRRLKLTTPLVVLLLILCVLCPAFGAQDDAERARAFQLFEEAKYAEALPVFEKLAAKYPDDSAVIKRYGLLMMGQGAYLKDPAARKEARRRGREILIRAQELGAGDALVRSMIESVPPDGGDDTKFSSKKEAEDAMREGEAAFAKKDFGKALELYQLALMFDPELYEAALFTGDVYFARAEQKKAGEWFGRAAAINPDRETAYRYWGDALMKQGRVTEAGDKFIEAYLAEPYSRLTRAAFLNWGQRVNVNLNHPAVEIPTSVSSSQPGQVTINLDPNSLKKEDKSGAGAAWITYGLIRGGWGQAHFAKEYPQEKKYRHSLKEEADALRAALKIYQAQQAKSPQSTDPAFQTLAKLEKEGFLEAFILLALPNEGIAQDYPVYRHRNLDVLRRYVKQYVLTGGAGQ